MSATMPGAVRTARALQARRDRTQAMLARTRTTLDQMHQARRRITVVALAGEADVSRTFLYEHPEARAMVAEAVARSHGQRVGERRQVSEALDAAWRERALNAEDTLKAANSEIQAQRRHIGELLGQVRDLSSPWQEQDVVRIMTEHGTLQRRVQELGEENRSLATRLKAARDNARFADRRIAELEVQLLETTGVVRER